MLVNDVPAASCEAASLERAALLMLPVAERGLSLSSWKRTLRGVGAADGKDLDSISLGMPDLRTMGSLLPLEAPISSELLEVASAALEVTVMTESCKTISAAPRGRGSATAAAARWLHRTTLEKVQACQDFVEQGQ